MNSHPQDPGSRREIDGSTGLTYDDNQETNNDLEQGGTMAPLLVAVNPSNPSGVCEYTKGGFA